MADEGYTTCLLNGEMTMKIKNLRKTFVVMLLLAALFASNAMPVSGASLTPSATGDHLPGVPLKIANLLADARASFDEAMAAAEDVLAEEELYDDDVPLDEDYFGDYESLA